MKKGKFPSFNSEQADHLVELVKEMLGADLAGIIDRSEVNMNNYPPHVVCLSILLLPYTFCNHFPNVLHFFYKFFVVDKK